MGSRHLNFLGDRACLQVSSSDGLKLCCGSHLTQNCKHMEIGQYAEAGGQYVFCQTHEEAKVNHERYHSGLLNYKEVPVVAIRKHVELLYEDQTIQTFRSHLGDIGGLEYQAMAADLTAEEKKTADQMASQVIAQSQAPDVNYDKLASILASEARKTTNQIISHVLAGIQQPAIDHSKVASVLAAEEKKSTDQAIREALANIQQPTIDYDKLVIAFDRNSDSAAVNSGQGWSLIITILVSLLAVIVSSIMAAKKRRGEEKNHEDASEKLKKWSASRDKYDATLTSKETYAYDSKKTRRKGGDDENDKKSEDSDESIQSDNGDDGEDNEIDTTTTTKLMTSVPTFAEYVHGKASSHSSSFEKAKVVDVTLSGFKDPVERELLEDMLLDATCDIMKFEGRAKPKCMKSLREAEARKNGLDLVKICKKGKQYTEKARGMSGVGSSSNTRALEKKYRETLDKGYNTGPSALSGAAKKGKARSRVYKGKHYTSPNAIVSNSYSTRGNNQIDADASVEPSEWKGKTANFISSTRPGMLNPSTTTGVQSAFSKAKLRP